jgi:predicted transcriptional regulator
VVRSVRFEPELEERLAEVAKLTGRPASQIIREAVRRHCAAVAGDGPGAGVASRRTGRELGRLVRARQSRRRNFSPNRRNGGEAPTPVWLARLGMYPEKVALRFATDTAFGQGIRLLWSDPELRGMPRDHPDARTLLVPAVAVEVLRGRGLRFDVLPVVSAGDLPAERVSQLRVEQGTR